MAAPPVEHRVAIIVGSQLIAGWETYEVTSSMVNPADTFTLTRPFDAAAYRLCDLDAPVSVMIDDVVIINGRIDSRHKGSADGSMTIGGRDKGGRLVQESIPSPLGVDNLSLIQAAQKIVSPWFEAIALSDVRNRRVRLGRHGAKAATGSEPIVLDTKKKTGQLDPGMMRWNALEELVSRAGLCCWSSADGKELVIGEPNYSQAPQWLFRHVAPGSPNFGTVMDLEIDEDIGDRFSEIEVTGSGAGGSTFGAGTLYKGRAVNGPGLHGIGVDFSAPKRLRIAEHSLTSNAEANAVAAREMARRDFRGIVATATTQYHGQMIGSGRVIYAPNTMARA